MPTRSEPATWRSSPAMEQLCETCRAAARRTCRQTPSCTRSCAACTTSDPGSSHWHLGDVLSRPVQGRLHRSTFLLEMPNVALMVQLSRPYQIALGALALFAIVWLL